MSEPIPLLQLAGENSRVRLIANCWDAFFERPDRPERELGPVPKRGYVVCLTPRSGSTWLAALATRTGLLGLPREYFNPDWPLTESSARNRSAYLDDVLRAAATPNGVYGVKADFDQVASFIFSTPVLRLPQPETTYIYLTREDLVLQAISYHKAAQSGAWTSRRTAKDYTFDRDAIWHQVRRLSWMMRAWELTFASFGLAPMRITYEQLEKDPVGVLGRIATAVGVELDNDALSLEVATQRQRTPDDERMRDEFIASSLEELGALDAGALAAAGRAVRATASDGDEATGDAPADDADAQLRSDAARNARVENEKLTAEVKRLQDRTKALNAENTVLRREVDTVTHSTSWRTTAPLRSVGSALRRVRRRGSAGDH